MNRFNQLQAFACGWKTKTVALIAAAMTCTTVASAAPEIVFQQQVQGGVSVDGAGVSNNGAQSTTFLLAPKQLTVQIPATATVTRAFAIVHPQFRGFIDNTVTAKTRLNGVLLSTGTVLNAPFAATKSIVVDVGTGFGINGAGVYNWEERADADAPSIRFGSQGIGGVQLVVVYTDTTVQKFRHVTVANTRLTNGADSLTGLPRCGNTQSGMLSVQIGWECDNEQNSTLDIQGLQLATGVGGSDDGNPLTPTCQNWNALHTVGSFGYNDAGDIVGVAGDVPNGEPVGGNATNGRLSDELYFLLSNRLDNTGSLSIQLNGDRDEYVGAYVLAIDMSAQAVFSNSCSGAAPTCNATSLTCQPCGSNFGSGGLNACPSNAAAICDLGTGRCNGCNADNECAASNYCRATDKTCVSKLANGNDVPNGDPTHNPVFNGVCSAQVGTAACVSAVCDTGDNKCGYLNGGISNCDNNNASVVCRSSVCGGDFKCGYPNNEGPCDNNNASVVCRSGVCSVSNKCVAAGACLVDGDCAGNQFCSISTQTCVGKLANGTDMPTDVGHAAPVLNGVCNNAAAALVCASGVCDTTDNKCGFSNGQGTCNSQNSATVCRSGACDANDLKCGLANGGTCGQQAAVCRSNVCNAGTCSSCGTDQDCGNATSGKVCTASGDAGSACVNGCRGTGGNGCAQGQNCSSTTSAVGTCSTPVVDAGTDARPDGQTQNDASTGDSSTSDSATSDATTNDAARDSGSDTGITADAGLTGDSLEGGGIACSTNGVTNTAGTASLGAFVAMMLAMSRRKRSEKK